MYTLVYNGRDCRDYSLMVMHRPDIPSPVRRMTATTIPGRSGVLYEDDGTYNPIRISVQFNFIAKPDDWSATLRGIRSWLLPEWRDVTEPPRLFFTDDDECFYRVINTELPDSMRSVKRLGVFTAVFICDPYTYMRIGDSPVINPIKLYNPSDRVSHPVYRITGEGMCTISVNGRSMTANVGQELLIDTDLMIAYKDGLVSNTAVAGDYEDLWMEPGELSVNVSDRFTLYVTPRWRYV